MCQISKKVPFTYPFPEKNGQNKQENRRKNIFQETRALRWDVSKENSRGKFQAATRPGE